MNLRVSETTPQIWGNVIMTNQTTTEDPELLAGLEHEEHSLFDTIYHGFQFLASAFGILFNCIVLDVSRRVQNNTPGAKWIQYLAIWDNVFLAHVSVTEFYRLTVGSYLIDAGVEVCKLISFSNWISSLTASSHLVALAGNRAINMAFPDWHYAIDWLKINFKISVGMAIFHAVILTPMLFLYTLEGVDKSCEMTSEYEVAVKLYQLIVFTMFYSVTHFFLVLTASVIFVYQLKVRRTPGVLKEHTFGSRNQNSDSETRASKCNDTVSIEMDGKEHKGASNTNAVLGSGPKKMISTNMTDDKAKEVASSIKENQSNTIEDQSKFENQSKTAQDQSKIENQSKFAKQPVASSLSYKVNKGASTSSSNCGDTEKIGSTGGLDTYKRGIERKESEPKMRTNQKEAGEKWQKGEKVAPRLTKQDLSAIQTIQLVCAWYLFCRWSSVALYLVAENVSDDVMSENVKYVLKYMTNVLTVCNSSFYLFAYLRGRAFRSMFMKRWMSWMWKTYKGGMRDDIIWKLFQF